MKQHYLTAFLSLAIGLQVQATTLTINVKDSDGKALADAVVYVQPVNAVPGMSGADQVLIEQKGKEFQPFVNVIPTGTQALFPNRDGIGHHVYSFSGAKTFQLPLSEQETTNSVLFNAPGVVTVGCNIHDWMVTYIYVVNTPFYAVTGDDGISTFKDVTAGSYTLHIWHPGIKTGADMQQQLTISGNAAEQLNFAIDIKPEYFWKPARPADNEEVEY